MPKKAKNAKASYCRKSDITCSSAIRHGRNAALLEGRGDRTRQLRASSHSLHHNRRHVGEVFATVNGRGRKVDAVAHLEDARRLSLDSESDFALLPEPPPQFPARWPRLPGGTVERPAARAPAVRAPAAREPDHTNAISTPTRNMLVSKLLFPPRARSRPTPVPPHARPGPSLTPGGWGRGRIEGLRHHESNAGNCHSRRIDAHDGWRKCLPVECERESVVRKSGSRNLCEPVVLLVEDEPLESEANGQALSTLRAD
jgi:hypothetical protein